MSKNDNTRIDLIVANDQHLYLKACDYKERQKWLVALASQKATHSTKQVLSSNTSAPLASPATPHTSDQLLSGNDETNSDVILKIMNNSFHQNLSNTTSLSFRQLFSVNLIYFLFETQSTI